jgi:hypothetical protein
MEPKINKISSEDLRKLISEQATNYRRKRELLEERERLQKILNECECEHAQTTETMDEMGMLGNIFKSTKEEGVNIRFHTEENNGAYDVFSNDKQSTSPITRIYPKHGSEMVSMFIPFEYGYGKSMDFSNNEEAIKFLSTLQNTKDKHDSDKFNVKYSLK